VSSLTGTTWDLPLMHNDSTFTPFHLLVLLFASLALVASQIDLPPEMRVIAGMWKRAMVLLVV